MEILEKVMSEVERVKGNKDNSDLDTKPHTPMHIYTL